MKEIIDLMMSTQQEFMLIVTDYTAHGGATMYRIGAGHWVITRLLSDAFVISDLGTKINDRCRHVGIAYTRVNRVEWVGVEM